MSLLLEQISESIDTVDLYRKRQSQVLKYVLKCESCLWRISFYESTQSVCLDGKKMKCPICKDTKKKSLKIVQ